MEDLQGYTSKGSTIGKQSEQWCLIKDKQKLSCETAIFCLSTETCYSNFSKMVIHVLDFENISKSFCSVTEI